jgi:hypothetical protein
MSTQVSVNKYGGGITRWHQLPREVRADVLAGRMPELRADVSNALFLARELEQIEAKSYEVTYEDLRSRLFIPAGGGVSPGATSVSYDQYELVGKAKVMTGSGRDLPRSDAAKQNFIRPILELGTSLQWSTRELANAAFAGESLEEWKAKAARRSIEQAIDDIAAFGEADAGFTGFTNDANVNVLGLGASRWSAPGSPATADQVMADMNRLVQETVDASKDSLPADTILLPSKDYAYAAQLRIPDTDTTVLKFYLANNPYIKAVESWPKLESAGAGSVPRIVAYRREQEVLDLVVPLDFSMLPPQADGLDFLIPCHALTAGCRIRKPFAICYGDFA